MPKDYSRTERIGEQIQRELAILIQQEMRDPRVRSVTVNHVDVTRDLSLARVYITLMDKSQSVEQALSVLDKAGGFLRRALGENLILRTVPKLDFRFDESVERGVALSQLIDKAVANDRAAAEDRQEPDQDPDSSDDNSKQ